MGWPCIHKTVEDHMVLSCIGRRLWTCSSCGIMGTWGLAWGYYGNIECKVCWEAEILFVYCSDECRKSLSRRKKGGEEWTIDQD